MYNNYCKTNHDFQPNVSWNKALSRDKDRYRELVDSKLRSIDIPYDAILCTDNFCLMHKSHISQFHDNIIDVLVLASHESIPYSSSKLSKIVPGWNEYVNRYFESALFWHYIWIENGRPGDGILTELRRKTRAQYHKAYKLVIRCEGEIKTDKIERAFDGGMDISAWSTLKKTISKTTHYPKVVDEVTGSKEIADLFASKFKDLYNVVGYDEGEMTALKNKINNKIQNVCRCNLCPQGRHEVTSKDVRQAVRKLQKNKRDGNTDLMSDHIIEGGDRLNIYIAFLLTAMISHGNSPDDMVLGTLVPLPKGKWSNGTLSGNYRAIALSSIFGKILDMIIMVKEEERLVTSKLQYGFKKGSSTSLCTSMVQETVSYFVNKNTNVYAVLLDATKAFDRINYVKLFHKLLLRNICPLLCRLLLGMYMRQKLRVQWQGKHSDSFQVSNGVKQGGVISPVLFCIYMDDLLGKLEDSGIGCYMGRVFSGAFAYADDLTLLSPSIVALKEMLRIGSRYALEYDIKFNGSKSQMIVFRCNSQRIVEPYIEINGSKLEVFKSVIHLGHVLHENIYNSDVSKCVSDFNRQSNIFLANFKHASSHFRNYLFHKFCSSFYGTQILPMYDGSFSDIFKAWRMVLRRVWRVPWRTHCKLLPN